jgi:hypothetical protein
VQRPGHGLEPRFYVDDDVFARERVVTRWYLDRMSA